MSAYISKQPESTRKPAANHFSKKENNRSSISLIHDNRPQAIAQLKLQETIQNSSRSKQLTAIQKMAANHTAQLAAKEDEKKPLQGKFTTAQLAAKDEEKKLLQGKFATAQLAAKDEEKKPLQGKFATAQLAAKDEEKKPLQGKFTTAQLAAKEEEKKPLQGKFATAQLAAKDEEKKLLQGKFATAQLAAKEEEKKPLQGKFTTAQLAAKDEEKKLLQGKFTTAQLAAKDEEKKPLQGKFTTAQLAAKEEEKKPLQGKFATTQLAAKDEEKKPLQGKFTTAQLAAKDEEKKLLQGKFATAQLAAKEEEKKPLQGKFTTAQLAAKEEEKKLLQGKFTTAQSQATHQHSQRKNNTGLPNNLKEGVEALSGYSMDDVKVHYNSSRPAQLQAHAYAQGTDIHIAPGQEKHLPHETWHVVQQKQGRVQPTMQLKDAIPVNDDKSLEKEADVMGAKAFQFKYKNQPFTDSSPIGKNVVQRAINIEEGSKEITTEEAVIMAMKKYPMVIKLSPEIFDKIRHFLSLYSNSDRVFTNEKEMWDTLDQDLYKQSQLENKIEEERQSREEYFYNALNLLCAHEPLVDRFCGFIEEFFLEGEFDKAIKDKDVLNEIKKTAKLLEQVVAENTIPDEEYDEDLEDSLEDPIISEYNLDTYFLYRAEDIPLEKEISKSSFPLYGFFSTSLNYSKQFYKGGTKGNYNTMIKITLSKPIGNVLIELLQSKDAFKQNAGEVGKVLAKKSGAKSDQNSVQSKLYKQGILDNKGKLVKGLKRNMIGGDSRKNVPNAVMIKQEPDAITEAPITNIEITSRLKNRDEVLIDHPLDKYVIRVERMDPKDII